MTRRCEHGRSRSLICAARRCAAALDAAGAALARRSAMPPSPRRVGDAGSAGGIAIADLSPLPRLGFKGRGHHRGRAEPRHRCSRRRPTAPSASRTAACASFWRRARSSCCPISPATVRGLHNSKPAGASRTRSAPIRMPRRDSHAWLAVAGRAGPGDVRQAVRHRSAARPSLPIFPSRKPRLPRCRPSSCAPTLAPTPSSTCLRIAPPPCTSASVLCDAAEEFGGRHRRAKVFAETWKADEESHSGTALGESAAERGPARRSHRAAAQVAEAAGKARPGTRLPACGRAQADACRRAGSARAAGCARQHARGGDRARGARLPQQARHHRFRSRPRRGPVARHAVEDRERRHLGVADDAAAPVERAGRAGDGTVPPLRGAARCGVRLGRPGPADRAARHARGPPVSAARAHGRHCRAPSSSSRT